jgi:predicted nucleotide-binding protein
VIDALKEQRIVLGSDVIADALLDVGEVKSVPNGEKLISEGDGDTAVYLILAGSFNIVIGGKRVAVRGRGVTVGELSWVDPAQPRSADVIAAEESVVLAVPADRLTEIALEYPGIFREVSKDIARRLIERNRFVAQTNQPPRVFIVSSTEALPIAQQIQLGFEHDDVDATVWTDGVFVASSFPLESLEEAIEASDFAIAVVHPDDIVETRDKRHRTPRDNVIFELGLFIGRIGRHRTFLIEPRGEEVKLPSDLKGITTITYRNPQPGELAQRIAPVCTQLRHRIRELGPI